MSRNKNRPSSQANLLREQGVPALGEYGRNFNPIGFYNPDREKYMQIYTNYDLNQCASRFYWEDLPNGITSWNLERMVYYRGSLCGFKYGGLIHILPYVQVGVNAYGLPTKVQPITYNGQAPQEGDSENFFAENFTLPVDNYGNENEDYNAVILYDSIPYSPNGKSPSRYFLNQIIIKDIADTLARININIVVSNKKILLEIKDPKQRDIIQKELETAFNSDCPFALITSPLESNSIQSTSDFNADELFGTIKNYDSLRCFLNGISSTGFGSEKKERLVTGELAGAEEQKDLVLDMAFELRKLFAEQMNKAFGTNIKVYKRAEDYKQEMLEQQASTEFNGNGETAKEEAGE